MNRTAFVITIGLLLGVVLALSACAGAPAKTKPHSIPAAPSAAPVVTGHFEREKVQFAAADRIDVVAGTVGGDARTSIQADTETIRQANRDASAAQIDDMAKAYGATVKAQAGEMTRLTAENTKLTTANTELQAKLDDFGRKVAVYTANGIGALLLLGAVAVGIMTKSPTYVAWCVAGSSLGFGTARVVGHWIFPWVVGVGAVLTLSGGIVLLLHERRNATQKSRQLAAGDDVIAAVEEVRTFLKSPPSEVIESIRTADTHERAAAAFRVISDRVKGILSTWVSKDDGTAAVVDARRRALNLI